MAGGDAALLVRDEFAIGDEIVVAPVLEQGQTTREGTGLELLKWEFGEGRKILFLFTVLFCFPKTPNIFKIPAIIVCVISTRVQLHKRVSN